MATPIKIPDLGTTTDKVKLVRWLREEGERVARGEPLCEVETDKAASELESVAEGVLLRRVVAEGSDLEQGTVIAYVGQPGEAVPEPTEQASPLTEAVAETAAAPPRTGGGRIPLMLRNLARRHGVDLAAVRGTGPDGQITENDILGATPAGATPAATEPTATQQAVIRSITRSAQQTVPFNLVCRIEMAAAAERLRRAGEQLGRAVGYDALFVHAAAHVLGTCPALLRRLDGDTLTTREQIDVAFVASFPQALHVLVVEAADRLSLVETEQRVGRLLLAVARGKAPLVNTARACLTVSNLSRYPIHSFNAVIPAGQTAALALAAVEDVVVAHAGQLVTIPVMYVTLTVDHRLVNGRQAAEFLQRLKQFIEGVQ